MPQEIERKFLVDYEKVKPLLTSGTKIIQGYIPTEDKTAVRVRLIKVEYSHGSSSTGFLTVKGENKGMTRAEFEYKIPADEAMEMLKTLCKSKIKKTRYVIEAEDGHTWEVDIFSGGRYDGLVVAEVEIKSEDEKIEFPDWVSMEVTNDPNYYNYADNK